MQIQCRRSCFRQFPRPELVFKRWLVLLERTLPTPDPSFSPSPRPAPVTARWLATWFGAGHSPVAPGTVGAIASLPLHIALRTLGPIPHATVTLLLTAAGVWASGRVAEASGEEDPQSIVIDEVVGTLLALGIAGPGGLAAQVLAFVAFRVLDVKKPWIIDDVQRLEPAGLGIMADDVLAGIGAGLLGRAFGRLLR